MHPMREFAGRVLLRRVATVVGTTVVAQALTALTYVIAARALGPALFGKVAVAISVGAIGVVVYDLGLNDMMTREVAATRIRVYDARRVLSTKRLFAPLLLAPVIAAAFLAGLHIWDATFYALVSWALWEAQASGALLRGTERFGAANSCQILGRLAGVLMALVLQITGTWTALLFALCLLLSNVFEAVTGRFMLGANHDPVLGDALRLGRTQRAAVSFGLTSLSASAQQLDTPIVALGGGVIEAGVYAAAGRLIGPLNLAGASLRLVSIPWLSRAQKSPRTRQREELRVEILAIALSCLPIIAGIIGLHAIPTLLGLAYQRAGEAFLVLAFGAAFSTWNQGLAAILQSRRAQKAVAAVVATGLMVGLAATYLMSMWRGAVGAAYGLVVSQVFIALALRSFLARRRQQEPCEPSPSPKTTDHSSGLQKARPDRWS